MASGSDGDLPRGIALAWGVAANPQRGPRRELNLEGIVDAAVAIADAEGLGAVSMSSVSTALGFTTMSLYRYVSAKDDLILLMQEQGNGLPPLSIEDADGWREGLIKWYHAMLATYADHPWLLDIPIDSEPNTPNSLAWLDAGLAVLQSTPLDPVSRVAALQLLSGHARWEGQIQRNPDGPAVSMRIVAELITPEQFPHLAPAIAAGAFSGIVDGLEFGLLRILDGIDRQVSDTASGAQLAEPQLAPEDRAITRDEAVRKARERVKDAESKLRDARQKEREALAKARERQSRDR